MPGLQTHGGTVDWTLPRKVLLSSSAAEDAAFLNALRVLHLSQADASVLAETMGAAGHPLHALLSRLLGEPAGDYEAQGLGAITLTEGAAFKQGRSSTASSPPSTRTAARSVGLMGFLMLAPSTAQSGPEGSPGFARRRLPSSQQPLPYPQAWVRRAGGGGCDCSVYVSPRMPKLLVAAPG